MSLFIEENLTWLYTSSHISKFSLILVNAFVEMTEYLLKHEGVMQIPSVRKVLSRPWPVEEFFGNQRAKGGRCDNPTVKEFCDTSVNKGPEDSSTPSSTRELFKETGRENN